MGEQTQELPEANVMPDYMLDQHRQCPGGHREPKRGAELIVSGHKNIYHTICGTCDRIVAMTVSTGLVRWHQVPRKRYASFRTRLRIRWHTFLQAASS